MPLNDELTKYFPSNSSIGRYIKRKDLYDSYESSLGSITSRDSIINPYDYINISDYGNSAEDQARYNQELARLQRIAEMQEASYQDWFNSPEQMAIRQREAGLNPDLVGIEGTASASDTQMPEGSPLANIPTDEQNFASIVGGIGSIVGSLSSVASLATSFSNLGLIQGQKNLQSEQITAGKIANISAAENLFNQGISNRLSNAISSAVANNEVFDVDSWFKNDDNFVGLFESFGFEDNVLYRDAFQRAKEARQKHAQSAYDATTGTLRSQKTYAEGLADPTYDSNVLLQRSYMEPVMEAEFKLREARAEFDKKVLDFKTEYMSNLDVDGIAEGVNNQAYQHEYDLYIKRCQSIIEGATSDIYSNWRDGYNSHKDDAIGMAFSYMIMNQGQVRWQEYLATHAYIGIGELVQDVVNDFGYQDTDNNPLTNEGVLGWKLGRPRK